MKSYFYIIVLMMLLVNCKSETKSVKQPINLEVTVENEDELLIRLSSMLVDDPQSQYQKEQNDIVMFAIDNNWDIQLAEEGFYYQVITQGEGNYLKWGDRIQAHYKGYFLDKKVFDSSYDRAEPLEFYIGNMIRAWNEGLTKIKKGGQMRLLVPSHYGYGEEGVKDSKGKAIVPPNSTLVFEITVL